jgi:hypothetical protein
MTVKPAASYTKVTPILQPQPEKLKTMETHTTTGRAHSSNGLLQNFGQAAAGVLHVPFVTSNIWWSRLRLIETRSVPKTWPWLHQTMASLDLAAQACRLHHHAQSNNWSH